MDLSPTAMPISLATGILHDDVHCHPFASHLVDA